MSGEQRWKTVYSGISALDGNIYIFIRALDSVTIARVQNRVREAGVRVLPDHGEGPLRRTGCLPPAAGGDAGGHDSGPSRDVVQAGDTILTLQMEPLQENGRSWLSRFGRRSWLWNRNACPAGRFPRVTQDAGPPADGGGPTGAGAWQAGPGGRQEDYDQNVMPSGWSTTAWQTARG